MDDCCEEREVGSLEFVRYPCECMVIGGTILLILEDDECRWMCTSTTTTPVLEKISKTCKFKFK